MMTRSAELRKARVVEGEMMVAMYVEELLLELGVEVAEIATGLDQVMPLARGGDFDFAVRDINLWPFELPHCGRVAGTWHPVCVPAATDQGGQCRLS
jgi:hypothetical protein